MAYYRVVCHFFGWVEEHRIGELADIEPLCTGRPKSPPEADRNRHPRPTEIAT